MFTSYVYIAPQITDEAGLDPRWITPMLLLFGLGLFIGNHLGGRYADRNLSATVIGSLATLATTLFLMTVAMQSAVTAVPGMLLFGAAAFAVAPLQLRVMQAAGHAPDVASAANISAFRLGSAIGIPPILRNTTLMWEKMLSKPRARRGFGRVEKRTNGRYRAACTGPDRELYRAPMTFGSKDDAIARLSARRAEIEMQVWAPEVAARGAASRSVPTLQAHADVWLETRKTKGRELRPTTRRQYRMLLDKFIYPTFGDKRIDKISNEDVNDWYDALAPGRETIRAQSYSLLRTIFAGAASMRPHPVIPYNPAHIRGAGNTKRAHYVEPATLEELRVIVEELPTATS